MDPFRVGEADASDNFNDSEGQPTVNRSTLRSLPQFPESSLNDP
jgi:hypothetical protein